MRKEEMEPLDEAQVQVKRVKAYAVHRWPKPSKEHVRKRINYYETFLLDYSHYSHYYTHAIQLLEDLLAEERRNYGRALMQASVSLSSVSRRSPQEHH